MPRVRKVGVVKPIRPKIKDTPGAKRGVAPKKAAAPKPIKPPGPPPTPYDRYRETAPWAIPGLLQIDRDQAAHQSYVTDKVAPWLSQSLLGLQGYQDAAQSSYSNAIQGAAGGAMNVSAAMTPLGYGGGAMGGIVAGNNQYLTEGGSIRAAGGASALVQEALNRERMNKLSPIPYSQGAIQAVADYAKNLPTQYTERRRQFTEGVEKFIAEQQQAAAELAEEVRSNKVNEAIRATNAETNAAIQFGRLGLSAEDLANDSAPDPPGAPMPTNLPPGTIAVPTDDGGWTVRNDPTANGGGGGAGPKPLSASTISSMNGVWKGSPNKPPKLGPGWKRPVWDSGTQRWYAKREKGATGTADAPKAKAGSDSFKIQKDLRYRVDNGYIDDTDQSKGTPQLLRLLRQHQPSTPKLFPAWWKEAREVLYEENPIFVEWMVGYMERRKRGVGGVKWKGMF